MKTIQEILIRLKDASSYGDDMRTSRLVVYSDCADMAASFQATNRPNNEKSWLLQKVMQEMIKNNDHNTDMFKVLEKNANYWQGAE